jgi:protein phosphatase
MKITLVNPSLVLLMGASGSGKSTFARRHFLPTAVLSSDFFRGMVCDDESNQRATKDAFEVLHFVLDKRLKAGRLTVVDATNVQRKARRALLRVAQQHEVSAAAIALNLSEAICYAHNQQRPNRQVALAIVQRQIQQLQQSLAEIAQEDFSTIYILNSLEEIAAVEIEIQRLDIAKD